MKNEETISHEGIVTKITDDELEIKILAQSACAACHAKSACGMGEQAEKILTVPRPKGRDFALNQKVNVRMAIGQGNKAAVLAYLIPIVLLLAVLFVCLGLGMNEGLAALVSIIALVASVVFGVLSLTSNGGSKKVSPVAKGDSTAVAGSIVYFNIDEIIEGYDMANDLRSVVENKIQGIQSEIDRRGNKLQKDVNTFQDKISKGLLLPSVAESQQKKLQQQQADYQNFVMKKQNEMAEEQSVMMNQILDAIKTYVDEYNIDRQYSMILATQGAILPAPVVVGDDVLDITDEILQGLNDEYVKSKDKGEIAEEPASEE